MLTKLLGILCVGVFIGAAVVEITQRKRAKHQKQDQAEADLPPGPDPAPVMSPSSHGCTGQGTEN